MGDDRAPAGVRWQGKPVGERFDLQHVKRDDGCWEWTGARTAAGYGQFGVDGANTYAHRWAYTVYIGDIPEGMFVCHRCDRPWCVNPTHLFLGTAADNNADMRAKGRGHVDPPKEFCVNGHVYAETEVRFKDGRRRCRECAREANRKKWVNGGAERQRGYRAKKKVS